MSKAWTGLEAGPRTQPESLSGRSGTIIINLWFSSTNGFECDVEHVCLQVGLLVANRLERFNSLPRAKRDIRAL